MLKCQQKLDGNKKCHKQECGYTSFCLQHQSAGGSRRVKFEHPKNKNLYSGSGLLLIEDCYYKNKKQPCALLFYDHYKGGYEDLGGGYEKYHENLETTTMIEAQEESANLLNVMDSKHFQGYIDRKPMPRLAPNIWFRMYIMKVDKFNDHLFYQNLKHIKKQFKGKKVKKGWLEMSHVVRIPLVELFKASSKSKTVKSINGSRVPISRTRMYLDKDSVKRIKRVSKMKAKKLKLTDYEGDEDFLQKTKTYYLE